MDNARIIKQKKIVKVCRLVVFKVPPYSPELNRIEFTLGRLNNWISYQNLNNKDLKHVIMEKVKLF